MRKKLFVRAACLLAALLLCLALFPAASAYAESPEEDETARDSASTVPGIVDEYGTRTYLLNFRSEFEYVIHDSFDGKIEVYGNGDHGEITIQEDFAINEESIIWMPEYDFVIADGVTVSVGKDSLFRAKNLTVNGTLINDGRVEVLGLSDGGPGRGRLTVNGTMENNGEIHQLDENGRTVIRGEDWNVVADGEAAYTNPDTGFSALIIDELGLLSIEARESLLKDMKPITKYGSVAFWTTEEHASSEIEQARLKRRELFELESASIFVINMDLRKLTIQSYGEMYEVITKDRANSITNYVRNYATRGEYYKAASIAFGQIYSLMRGSRIPQPMKHFSNACIALMVGLIIMLPTAFSFASTFREPSSREIAAAGTAAFALLSAGAVYKGTRKTYSPPPSDSGGSSCSSCGGGGGGSSCSSCGGGGSSSF